MMPATRTLAAAQFDHAMPNPNPGFTVVVRTCGRSPVFLRRALGSIAKQTVQPAQIVVSNDGEASADLQSVVSAFGFSSVDVRIVHRTSGGRAPPNRSSALNRGVAAATSPWIAFLDDDDTWSPCFFERMIEAIRLQPAENPALGAVVCKTEVIYERMRGGDLRECEREIFNPDLLAISAADLVQRNRFTINAAVWRREVFARVDGFRDDLPSLEDWEFNVRASRRYRLAVLPEVLAFYHRRPPGSLASNSLTAEHDRMIGVLRREWQESGLLPIERSVAKRIGQDAARRFALFRARLADRAAWLVRR